MIKREFLPYFDHDDHGCGCGNHHSGDQHHDHDQECACGDDDHACTCGDDQGCDCGHDHDHDHEHHHHDYVTLELEDGKEIKCPIVDIYMYNEKSYIALLHPVEDHVLLYRFENHQDNTIDIFNIEDEDEYEGAAQKFVELQQELALEADEDMDEETEA